MTDQSLTILNILRAPGDRENYLTLLRHAEQAGLGRESWAERLRERLQTSDSPSTAWMSHLRRQLSLSKAWTKIKRKCA